jgi:NADPH-dependent ferric siderophore reductase
VTTTAPRLLQVRRSARVTPRMIRVTLAGDELAGFAGDGPDRRI